MYGPASSSCTACSRSMPRWLPAGNAATSCSPAPKRPHQHPKDPVRDVPRGRRGSRCRDGACCLRASWPGFTFVPRDLGRGHPRDPALQGHVFSHQRLDARCHGQDGRRLCATGRETSAGYPCSTPCALINSLCLKKPEENSGDPRAPPPPPSFWIVLPTACTSSSQHCRKEKTPCTAGIPLPGCRYRCTPG